MLGSEQQVEIAKRGMDAAFCYTQAAINATFEANAHTLRVWAAFASASRPAAANRQETWEWSGAPKRAHSSLLAAEQDASRVPQNPLTIWSDMMRAAGQPWTEGRISPFDWWRFAPQSAVPATWPWAYGMMSTGVPDSVAWPMAKGNVALMEAAQKTAAAVQPAFPHYRSDNGFAVAQIWMKTPVVRTIAGLAPASFLLWPWLERAASSVSSV
jgi:hypothetical protein